MVALLPVIVGSLNMHKGRVLLLAEAFMSPPQYKVFRKLFLDEFGKSGFEGKLARVLIEDRDRQRDKDRHG